MVLGGGSAIDVLRDKTSELWRERNWLLGSVAAVSGDTPTKVGWLKSSSRPPSTSARPRSGTGRSRPCAERGSGT